MRTGLWIVTAGIAVAVQTAMGQESINVYGNYQYDVRVREEKNEYQQFSDQLMEYSLNAQKQQQQEIENKRLQEQQDRQYELEQRRLQLEKEKLDLERERMRMEQEKRDDR